MIVVTFDDAVQSNVYDLIQGIGVHENPDGSPVPFTFFVSSNDSDYWLIHRLHAAGHEIAVHTMTHTTGLNTKFTTWIKEIEGCREALFRYAGIPREEIRGMRAPFLAYNGAMYEALEELGFSYSCSVLESPGPTSPNAANYIWPYTLHEGLLHEGWTGTGPARGVPGVMEIPMWRLKEGETYHAMDPGGSRESLFNVFKENLQTRYDGNRAPMGIWLHAETWLNTETTAALSDFLDWALKKEDVWVVSLSSLADWMFDPISSADIVASEVFFTPTFQPVPESETFFVEYDGKGVRTIHEQAPAYPAPGSIFLRSLPAPEISYRIEITSNWDSGFQADVIVDNPTPNNLVVWSVDLHLGNAEITSDWGPAAASPGAGDELRLKPSGGDPTLLPGTNVIFSFVASGTPDDLVVNNGRFARTGYPATRAAISRGPEGALSLQWDRTAPAFRIEKSATLMPGSWEEVDVVHGADRADLDWRGEDIFYRIQPIR